MKKEKCKEKKNCCKDNEFDNDCKCKENEELEESLDECKCNDCECNDSECKNDLD